MKRIISTVVAALFGVALLKAETVDTLRLSTLFTTHVVFRTELVYADLSNTKLIAAKIIEPLHARAEGKGAVHHVSVRVGP